MKLRLFAAAANPETQLADVMPVHGGMSFPYLFQLERPVDMDGQARFQMLVQPADNTGIGIPVIARQPLALPVRRFRPDPVRESDSAACPDAFRRTLGRFSARRQQRGIEPVRGECPRRSSRILPAAVDGRIARTDCGNRHMA